MSGISTNKMPSHQPITKKVADYTPAQLAVLEDKVRIARLQFMTKNRFFGMIVTKLQCLFTDDVPTAATDGRRIFFNPEFLERLTAAETLFLVAHEVWHVVFEHFLRRGTRNPELWNVAGDYVINYLLQKESIGKRIEGTLYDEKYADLSTENVYDLLQQKKKEDEKNGNEGGEDGELLDTHFDTSSGPGDEKQPNKSSVVGYSADGSSITTDKVMTDEEAKKVRDEIRNDILQAAKAVGAGNLPAEIQKIIDEFLNPKIKWQHLIDAAISSKRTEDRSFAYPERRSWSNPYGIIFPGSAPGTEIKLAISLDNSGSITEEMTIEYLSEVYGIMTQFDTFEITLMCFDTEVRNVVKFTQDNIEELVNYRMVGGGGTAIAANWDWMAENSDEFEADLFICFTDLYSGDLGRIDPNQIDTVWIISGNSGRDKPPFGRYAYYEDAKGG